MRIKRTYCLIATFIFSWIFLLYFTFQNRPNLANSPNDSNANEVFEVDIRKLEDGIQEEFKKNKEMVHNLHRFMDNKKVAGEIVDIEVEKSPMQRSNDLQETDVAQDGAAVNKKLVPQVLMRNKDSAGIVIPVLVFACNRVTVSRCLDQLLQYRPDPDQFPIIVSQDCNDEQTKSVINKYIPQVSLIQQPDQSDIEVPPKEKKFRGYFKIARHYGWALNEIFFNFNFKSVIIVEDDLDIAPDFFEYFLGTYPLLQKDPTLWCISAWNDNGKVGLIDEKQSETLYRTDFFPGLGWMLSKALWQELSPKWPRSYWDDWIRQPEQRKERACIRPEISRTRTFGKIGVSNGLFYEKHLKYIKLNEKFVPFSKMNMSYLIKENYDKQFTNAVYQSAVVSYQELREGKIAHDGPVRIVYYTKESYKRTAKMLGLMDDFRSGVPRTAYRGVITFYYKGRTVYLAPNLNWKGYDIKWS